MYNNSFETIYITDTIYLPWKIKYFYMSNSQFPHLLCEGELLGLSSSREVNSDFVKLNLT